MAVHNCNGRGGMVALPCAWSMGKDSLCAV